MNPASVGFQCPQCVGAGRSTQRAPAATLFGAQVRPGSGIVTKVLMGILVATFVLDLPTRGLISDWLMMATVCTSSRASSGGCSPTGCHRRVGSFFSSSAR